MTGRAVLGLCLLALLLAGARPAAAALTSDRLGEVGVERKLGGRLPLGLRFRDQEGRRGTLATLLGGRPALLMFADYRCKMICGTALRVLAGLLDELAAEHPGAYGEAYRVAVVGLDPKDGPAVAREALARDFGEGAGADGPRPLFLTGEAGPIGALAEAAGYRYAYDAESGEFAHPVVLIAVDGEGRVARYLPALGAGGRDLWLALNDAGAPSESLLQGLRALCYRFDPARGVYTPVIAAALPIACAATVLAIAGGLLFLSLRRRRGAGEGAGAGTGKPAAGEAPTDA